MAENLQTRLRSGYTWLRLFLGLAYFFVIFEIVFLLVGASFLFQFGYRLITGSDSGHLKNFTAKLNIFMFSTLNYLTFNSDDKPFPFNASPSKKDPTDSAG